MNHCSSCKNQINKSDIFCENCGTRVISFSTDFTNHPTIKLEKIQLENKPKKSFIKDVVLFTVIIILPLVTLSLIGIGYDKKQQNIQLQIPNSVLNNETLRNKEFSSTLTSSYPDTELKTFRKTCENLSPIAFNKIAASEATINVESLMVTTGSSLIISGTFSNASIIEVVIWNGEILIPLVLRDTFPSKPIWRDASDHGGQVDQCPIGSVTGRYFNYISTPLKEGVYTIGIYTYKNIYNPGYQGNTQSELLKRGTLRVIK